ncbi:MAG: hypothetical protein ACYCYL_05735 [Acidithiobacillus sp.]
MESPHLIFLKNAVNSQPASSEALRDALHRLDHMLTDLANDLRVTYAGPYVGLSHAPQQHQLCVAEQQWSLQERGWGAAICTNHPVHGWRAEWRLATVSRERLPLVVNALPALFAGYAAAADASPAAKRPSTRRIHEIAELFAH